MLEKDVRSTLAFNLRKLRIASGLTAKEVGEKVGKSEKTVSAWEHGRGQPDADMLFVLCDLYGVESFDVFYGVENAQADLTNVEKQLVSSFRTLNARGKQAVMDHLQIVCGNPDLLASAPPSSEKTAT